MHVSKSHKSLDKNPFSVVKLKAQYSKGITRKYRLMDLQVVSDDLLPIDKNNKISLECRMQDGLYGLYAIIPLQNSSHFVVPQGPR